MTNKLFNKVANKVEDCKVYNILNKIIVTIGLILLVIIEILNIIFVSKISNSTDEKVDIMICNISTILISLLIAISMYIISLFVQKKLCIENNNKNTKKIKYTILYIVIILYSIMQIFWINYINPSPVEDQYYTYQTSVEIYQNKTDITYEDYMTNCPHQITLAVCWSMIFKFFHTSNYRIINYMNILANVITIISIILITKKINRNGEHNIILAIVMISTFFTLPLLTTFMYGDLISISLSLLSIYMIMLYREKKRTRFAVIAALLLSISYMFRMNSLIFIIAILMYMIINLFENKLKEDKIKSILTIILVALIALLPNLIIKKYYQNKYDLNSNESIPIEGYIYMGMSDSSRQAGWFNRFSLYKYSYQNINDKKIAGTLFKEDIIERTQYFIKNPLEVIEFYTKKITSMWTENTYSSVWYNESFNTGNWFRNKNEYSDKEIEMISDRDNKIIKYADILNIYQKSLILLIFGLSIIYIILNNFKLKNDELLLIIVFVGGFLFQLIWEAKSRYIIPYIVVLIPLSSIKCTLEQNNVKLYNANTVSLNK